jgi:hypothetical protein
MDARNTKVKASADSVSGEGLFSASKMCTHMAEGAKQLPLTSFIKALILLYGQNPHDLIIS